MDAPEELRTLAKSLGIGQFDLLLVGDGSGSLIEVPCGWQVTSFAPYPSPGVVRSHFGGTSNGTNNYAELSPYLHALWVFHTERYGNNGDIPKIKLFVEVITDSQVTARCGNGEYLRRANAALWAQLHWFEKNGYAIHWNHVPRNSNPFSKNADRVANEARRKMCELLQ